MFSKCFKTWLNQNAQNLSTSKWSDFLQEGYPDKDQFFGIIIETLDAWHRINNVSQLEEFFDKYADLGFAVIDQTGEFVIVHHPVFYDTGRIFGYTTNSFTDKPIKVILDSNCFTPIKPNFPMDWNKLPPPLLGPSPNTNFIDTPSTNQPIPKKRRKSSRILRPQTTLEANNHIINSIVLVTPSMLAHLLPLKQPFSLPDIKNALDSLDESILEHSTFSQFSDAHKLLVLLCNFRFCADKPDFHFRTHINQVRDDDLLHTISVDTFPLPVGSLFDPPSNKIATNIPTPSTTLEITPITINQSTDEEDPPIPSHTNHIHNTTPRNITNNDHTHINTTSNTDGADVKIRVFCSLNGLRKIPYFPVSSAQFT
jgi:hypothetical protein